MTKESGRKQGKKNAVWILAVVILVPSIYGFGSKFLEFIKVYQSADEGSAFAIAPIMNYLLASSGFFLLFFWAIKGGMFKDIEKPKHDLLAREEMLDATEEPGSILDWH
ncbi:MAG: hypothetical protein RL885_16845 [Planctomycetota bacterium]